MDTSSNKNKLWCTQTSNIKVCILRDLRTINLNKSLTSFREKVNPYFYGIEKLNKNNYCVLIINNDKYSLHFSEKECFNSPKESRRLSVMKGAMCYVITKYFRRKFAG